MKEYIHQSCAIASDEVEQPPRATKHATHRCYRCGRGANNVQPVLLLYVVTEPVIAKEPEPAIVIPSEEVMDAVPEATVRTIGDIKDPAEKARAIAERNAIDDALRKDDEIAALKAQITELEQ